MPIPAILGAVISTGLSAFGSGLTNAVRSNNQIEAEQREEQRRRQAMLDDPTLMKQGYQRAGLSTANLQPTANQVGGSSAPDIENPLRDLPQLPERIMQLESTQEDVKTKQLNNRLLEYEVEKQQGYKDYVADWLGINKNQGTLNAMKDVDKYTADNAVNTFNRSIAEWKQKHPDYYEVFAGMPDLARKKLLTDIARCSNDYEFEKWKYSFLKDYKKWSFGMEKRERSLGLDLTRSNIGLNQSNTALNNQRTFTEHYNRENIKASTGLTNANTALSEQHLRSEKQNYDYRKWKNEVEYNNSPERFMSDMFGSNAGSINYINASLQSLWDNNRKSFETFSKFIK